MRAEKNRPANSSDDWTLVITCAWHYHKSQTADNTWAENYWKITRHYTTHACCYNRKTGLDLIVSHFEITVHIGHYTHKWNLNIKIKHGIWHSIIANNLCDKLSQKGDKNPYNSVKLIRQKTDKKRVYVTDTPFCRSLRSSIQGPQGVICKIHLFAILLTRTHSAKNYRKRVYVADTPFCQSHAALTWSSL